MRRCEKRTRIEREKANEENAKNEHKQTNEEEAKKTKLFYRGWRRRSQLKPHHPVIRRHDDLVPSKRIRRSRPASIVRIIRVWWCPIPILRHIRGLIRVETLAVWVIRHLVGRVGCGRWGISEETSEVVALDDLGQRTGLYMSDLDKGRFEGEYIGIVQCYK